jgi:hypothetical protein
MLHQLFGLLRKINPWCLVIFGVLLNFGNVYLYYRVGADQLLQIGSAVNFLKGNGFSLAYFFDSGITHLRLYSWPPLYSMVAVPLLWLSGNDVTVTVLTIYFFSFSLFFGAIKLFAETFFEDKMIVNSLLLFLSFSYAPLRSYGEIDILSVALYFIGVLAAIKIVNTNKVELKWLLLCCAIMFLLPMSRYAYIPQAIVIPIAIFWWYWKKGNLASGMKILLPLIVCFTVGVALVIFNEYFYVKAAKYFALDGVLKLPKTPYAAPMPAITHSSGFSRLYNALFSGLFPDYIFLSFLKRFSFYSRIVWWAMGAIFIVNIFIAFKLFRYFKNELRKLNDKQITQLMLMLTIVANILLFMAIYRTKTMSVEQILSGDAFYRFMSVTTRYVAPAAISTLFVIFYLAFGSSHLWAKVIVGFSVAFGLVYFVYNKASFSIYDREKNLYYSNLPYGSTNELMALRERLKNIDNAVFLRDDTEQVDRQISAVHIAKSVGLPIADEWVHTNLVFERKMRIVMSFKEYQKAYQSHRTSTVFKGRLYHYVLVEA